MAKEMRSLSGQEAKKCVQEFIDTYKVSTDPALWRKLVEEEYNECLAATDKANAIKEMADLIYVCSGYEIVDPDNFAIVYIVQKQAVPKLQKKFGITFPQVSEAFWRVHESNMSKLDKKGKPIYREDGKVMKGPNYKEPDLSDLV